MKEIIEDGDYKVTIDYENLTTTFELSERDAWLEEQRHKWMCGDMPELPEDCPF